MDLIGNLLSNLKQAGINNKKQVTVKRCSVVAKILERLYLSGYIAGFRLVGDTFDIYLKYLERKPFIYAIKRYTSYNKKYYCTVGQLIKGFKKSEFILISSPFGIITKDEALSLKTGGEVLFKIN